MSQRLARFRSDLEQMSRSTMCRLRERRAQAERRRMEALPRAQRPARKVADRLGAVTSLADRLLEWRSPSTTRRLSARELGAELLMAIAFTATATAMFLAGDVHLGLDAVLLVASYAVVGRVTFPFGPGFVRPTQLIFVPMLFLLPADAVPALTAAGAVLSALPEVARRESGPARLVVAVCDSWYSVGPALVMTLVGFDSPYALCALALAAQMATDLAASTLREWLGGGARPRELVQVVGLVYLADALLTPIGLLAVFAADAHPHAYLLVLPPVGLVALMARERGRRIERELELVLRAQAAHRRVGDAVASTLDRGALERVLVTTSLDAVHGDRARLSAGGHERLVAGDAADCDAAMTAAEQTLRPVMRGDVAAVAIHLGDGTPGDRRRRAEVLSVARIGAPFSDAERDLLGHLATQAAVSLENADLHALVQRQAITDELTGLLNHRRLQQVLEDAVADARQTSRPLALLMLDIDNFKSVNDTYGHRQGDLVLTAVAE